MRCEVLTPQQAGQQFPGAVAAIGNLDGVHLGHQALVSEAKTLADQLQAPLVVVSFEPHPKRYFDPNAPKQRLSPAVHKAELLDPLGVQALVNIPFVQETATMEASDFISGLLMETIGLKGLVAGPDFRFGKQRKGDLALASQLGMITRGIEWQELGGGAVSSSRIRTCLIEGEIDLAHQMLGKPYEVWGEVVRGDQLGRTIGFPTANVDTAGYCVPADGIYAAWTNLGDGRDGRDRWPTALYIGKRPSVDGVQQRFEAHLLDFDEDIYGREIRVSLRKMIRGDMTLDGLDALKAQIERDCADCRAVLLG